MKKLIQIEATGVKLFEKTVRIDLYAKNRVIDDDEYTNLLISQGNTKISTLNTIAFTGVNASGKTKAIQLIAFVILLLQGKSVNNAMEKLHLIEILDTTCNLSIKTLFYEKSKVYKLDTIIEIRHSDEGPEDMAMITEERLYAKEEKRIKSKKALDYFDESMLTIVRGKDTEYLPDDVSIIIGHNNKIGYKKPDTGMYMINEYNAVNFNFLYRIDSRYLPYIIKYLDSSIEYIDFKKDEGEFPQRTLRLKYKSDDNEIVLNNPIELENYISSGTIKGIYMITGIIRVLRNGGYYIIDEIENHFNQELVASIVSLFSSERTNPKGAVIIFTTHYPELLDRFKRNDNVYITRHGIKGITITNLSDELKRNDIKRSEILQSDYLGGTAPSYEAYMDLKKHIAEYCKED